MEIKTNNHARYFLYGYEVPKKVMKEQFSHLADDEKADGFFKYRGQYYHTSDFLRISEGAPADMQKWHGVVNDSMFSGVLIRISEDCEQYQVATFYC